MLPLGRKRGEDDSSGGGPRVNVVAAAMLLIPTVIGIGATAATSNPLPVIVGVAVGLVLLQAPKVAKQWERGVVLRLGRYIGLRGPGLFWVLPFVDSVTRWIDQRVITTSFAAEQTLTSDTVPVNVDAVLFWLVYDPEKAALEVQNYPDAKSYDTQTPLPKIKCHSSFKGHQEYTLIYLRCDRIDNENNPNKYNPPKPTNT